MKVKIERGGKGLWKRRARAISKGLNTVATPAAREAKKVARQGLMLNVYQTPEGRYRRTRQLLDQVYGHSKVTATSIEVLIGDTANYASFVEFGTGPHELTPDQLTQYLEALPRGGLLRFGRSGKAYLLPGPYIGPAITFARVVTRERFITLMQEAWK